MAGEDPVRFAVFVQPGARHSRVAGRHGDALKLQVQARPVDGAANRAVVELVAAALDVPRRAVHVVAGASSRRKLIAIDCGAQRTRCERRLAALYETPATVDNQPGRG